MKDDKSLLPEVSEVFNLVGTPVGKFHFNGFGVFDLSTLTLKQAEQLEKRDFPHLVRKEVKAKKTTVVLPADNQ